MSIRVGLELTALESDHRTRGMGRVAQSYFEMLSEDERVDLVPYTRGDFPRSEPNGDAEWSEQLMDPWRLSWFQRQVEPDVLQVIDPKKTPSYSSAPVVTMVHNLVPYLYRERYQTTLWSRFLHWRMKRQVRRSDFIVTPSNCTADDLRMLFDLDDERIETVYHGIDHDRFYPRDESLVGSIMERHGIESPYVLMVADLRRFDPRKKLLDVVDHWNHDRLDGLRLVVVGQEGEYGQRLRDRWKGRTDDLILTGYVNDDELACLYTGARALLFPSRHEGFGFPVVEAMACGTKPVVRGVGSIEEIAGSAAETLGEDRYAEQFVDAIERVGSSSSANEDCQRHAQQFTWQQSIDQLLGIYEKLGVVSERTHQPA